MSVKPKKHLGQHFLKDDSVCERMIEALNQEEHPLKVLEVGPGTGALTKFLLNEDFETYAMEVDKESIAFLKEHYPQIEDRIFYKDFLKTDLNEIFGSDDFVVIGNFPYNISSQILFKVLDYKDQIPVVIGMFQKEVAERVAEPPGTKKYGITSVLLQAFYDIEYLFTVSEHVFNPPPKVKSAVIKLKRNHAKKLDCDEKLFKRVVKTAFNQRRKTLRNSLKSLINELNPDLNTKDDLFQKRPERLSVNDFISLTQRLMV